MTSLKPSRIVAVYAVVSALWILLSDRLAEALFSESVGALTLVSTFKGWAYVAVVSAILLALLKRYEAQSKRQQAVIRQSEERLNLTLAAVSDGVWDWRVDTGEVFFNAAWYTMLGFAPFELPQAYETWAGLIHPEDREQAEETIRRHLESKEPFSMELRMRAKDGGLVWILDRGQVIQQDALGRAVRMVGTHVDITQRKRAEELRQQIERIVTHNLRTPASNAIDIAQMLRQEPDMPAEQREMLLDLFEQAGTNMLDTLNSTLDLYRIETGQYRCEPQVCNGLALLRELVNALNRDRRFPDVRGEVFYNGRPIGPEDSCACYCVPSLLRMALQNLLLNAYEASPPGGTVRVELRRAEDCRAEIRNTGAVPAEIRERFSEKYVTLGKLKGTGLGAYSARLMLQAQGGSVGMDTSDERDETVLTVVLPKVP